MLYQLSYYGEIIGDDLVGLAGSDPAPLALDTSGLHSFLQARESDVSTYS